MAQASHGRPIFFPPLSPCNRAQHRYFQEAQRLGQNASIPATISDFCANAIIAKPGTALYAGRADCLDADTKPVVIYNNLITQLELIGQPLSQGAAGEGVRLLLGTDLTGLKGKAVANPNGARENQNLIEIPIKTKWLFAASPEAFDPLCANPDVEGADRAGCAVIGTWRSCGMNCGSSLDTEKRWASRYYPLGFASDLWTPANGDAWRDLRAMLTAFVPEGAIGNDGDTMKLLQMANIPNGIYPFRQMIDRPYWIVNATAQAFMREIALGNDYYPKRLDYLSSSLGTAASCAYDYTRDFDKYFDHSGSNYEMPFVPKIEFPQSQCFAAYNPVQDSYSSSTLGRASGTSGIFCSYLDFPALFDRKCVRSGYQNKPFPYLCDAPLSCDATYKSSLVAQFGAAVAGFGGAMGNLSASCAWDPFTARSNGNGGGVCMLTGPSNPNYLPDSCSKIAPSDLKGILGKFSPVGSDRLLYPESVDSIARQRTSMYACVGGSQSRWKSRDNGYADCTVDQVIREIEYTRISVGQLIYDTCEGFTTYDPW